MIHLIILVPLLTVEADTLTLTEDPKGTRTIPIFDLCRKQVREFVVDDAVILLPHLNLNHNDTENLEVLRYVFDTGRCKGTFRLAPRAGTSFMVTLSNNLPINRLRCTAWNVIFKIRSAKQNFGFGCTKFAVHFFESPLSITFLPSAVKQLIRLSESHIHEIQALSLTITPVIFGCDDNSLEWSTCGDGNGICIKSDLFCDGRNNCGLWEDEKHCPGFNSTCPKIKGPEVMEDYVYYDDVIQQHKFDNVLSFVLAFCTFLVLTLFVTIVGYCAYLRKKLKSQSHMSVSNYLRQFRFSLYSRRKYCNKLPRPSDDVYAGELAVLAASRHHHRQKSSIPLLTDNGSVRNYCSNSVSDVGPIVFPAKCKRFF